MESTSLYRRIPGSPCGGSRGRALALGAGTGAENRGAAAALSPDGGRGVGQAEPYALSRSAANTALPFASSSASSRCGMESQVTAPPTEK